MKQIKLLGVLAIALCLGLSSCGKGGDDVSGDVSTSEQGSEEHVHTFETEWTSNGSKHWHKATCGHNVKGDEADHVFGDAYDTVAATCTEDGSQKRKCSVCDYVKTEKLTKLGHDAQPAADSDAWTIVTPASCTEDGLKTYHCSKCNTDVEVAIPQLGHDYKKDTEGNDLIEWTTAPTCTDAGVGGHRTCERCHEEIPVSSQEAAALGHNFHKDAEGNIEFTWSTEPSCTKPGVGTKHCDRCGQNIAADDDERKALGHDTELIGGAEEAPAGEATVRVWKCKRCGDEFLGFKATEVTAASKERLVFTPAQPTEGQEQSARFFGHPIGNDVPLNENGDPDRDNHPAIYNKNQLGDYFEYIFTLNAAQAAKMATVRCYCDAKPAQYLGANGIDFWANKSGDEDWTRGMYIDDNPDHYEVDSDGQPVMVDEIGPDGQATGQQIQKGKDITDYRYVLYVNDEIQEFDPDTKVSVPNGDPRGEYVMPYTFHLQEGRNKISLRMAGGYRSEFYSFVFRPYVEPTPITVNETSLEMREGKTAQITSSMTELKYASSNTGVATVDANGLVTGVKAGTATITVSKDGNFKDAKVAVTVLEKEGVITLALADGVIAPENGIEEYTSGSSGFWLRNPKKDATLTYTFNAENAGLYDLLFNLRGSNINVAEAISVKVNDTAVTVSGNVNGGYNAVEVKVGQATLKTGSNTMVITALADSSLYFRGFKLSPAEGEDVPAHVHDFATETPVAAKGDGYVGYTTAVCAEDNAKQIKIRALDGTFASGSSNKTGSGAPLEGYMKMNGNDQSISYKFDYAGAATKAKIYQYGYMDNFSSNGDRTYTSQQKNNLGPNGCNFGVNFNSAEVEITAETKATTYTQFFTGATVSPGGSGNSNLAACIIGEVNLVQGDNTFTFTRYDSFNLSISYFLIVIE